MDDLDIARISNMNFQRRGVDPNTARVDQLSFHQRGNKLAIEFGHALFTESLVEFDQRGGIKDRVHQGKMADIASRQALPNLDLDFFVAQSSAKLQLNYSRIDPHRCGWPALALVEHVCETPNQLGRTQKLVHFTKLFVQLTQPNIGESITKTHLLTDYSAHNLFYIIHLIRLKKFVTFSVKAS
jgi:hypothetical protein